MIWPEKSQTYKKKKKNLFFKSFLSVILRTNKIGKQEGDFEPSFF